MTDISKLAASLSEAQRRVVRREGFSDEPMSTVYAMLKKGLIYHHIDSPNGRCGPMRLTATGLQVRDHLIQAEREGE